MGRHDRVERALRTHSRGAWLLTIVIVLAGALIVSTVFSPGERRRGERLERLRLGDSKEQVAAVFGSPAESCPPGALEHLRTQMSPDWSAPRRDAAIAELEQRTSERWVYPIGEREPPRCTAQEGDTEIGFDEEDRVLWLVGSTGRSLLEVEPGVGLDE